MNDKEFDNLYRQFQDQAKLVASLPMDQRREELAKLTEQRDFINVLMGEK